MKNLAPKITRQRLLIEGFYAIEMTPEAIEDYFTTITSKLGVKMYGQPIIFSPGGEGREENQGFDAFVPLIDSGISFYAWTEQKFLSVVIYTCKKFDADLAERATREFFEIKETARLAF